MRRWRNGVVCESPGSAPRNTGRRPSYGCATKSVRRPKKIVPVQDNLNTRTPAPLYEAFRAEVAMRLKERIEWHYTPNHGSWLTVW